MKSVLAVFAKSPVPGLVKTRLVPELSPEEGAKLYRCMLLDTLERVRSLAVDLVVFYQGDEEEFRQLAGRGATLVRQHPGGLGERLQEAFATLDALGYRDRVVIGTDAPDLPLEYLRKAFRLLEGGSDVVFGPAEDGGYYLVALRGPCGTLFQEIPWSGPQVLAVSRQRARESGLAAALLPPWYDVDNFQDLLRPGLLDPQNGAPLTRDFLLSRGIGSLPAAATR